MLIKRKDATRISEAVQGNLKDKNFNIQTQYKILKLVKAIENEDELLTQTMLKVVDEFALKDEEGNIIKNENNGIKIDHNKELQLAEKIEEMNSTQLQLPDIYFSLDELDGLGLTLNELNAFMPFIK